jgi:hypothetical protein
MTRLDWLTNSYYFTRLVDCCRLVFSKDVMMMSRIRLSCNCHLLFGRPSDNSLIYSYARLTKEKKEQLQNPMPKTTTPSCVDLLLLFGVNNNGDFPWRIGRLHSQRTPSWVEPHWAVVPVEIPKNIAVPAKNAPQSFEIGCWWKQWGNRYYTHLKIPTRILPICSPPSDVLDICVDLQREEYIRAIGVVHSLLARDSLLQQAVKQVWISNRYHPTRRKSLASTTNNNIKKRGFSSFLTTM